MKTIAYILFFISALSINGYAQIKLPIKLRIEKQAMSTPMGPLDEVFFSNYFDSRPINIKFDGSLLNMEFDNGTLFQKIDVSMVKQDLEIEEDQILTEKLIFINKQNFSDTISLVIDHQFGYVQFIIPTKNSKGDYWGYTSYRQHVNLDELALK